MRRRDRERIKEIGRTLFAGKLFGVGGSSALGAFGDPPLGDGNGGGAVSKLRSVDEIVEDEVVKKKK